MHQARARFHLHRNSLMFFPKQTKKKTLKRFSFYTFTIFSHCRNLHACYRSLKKMLLHVVPSGGKASSMKCEKYHISFQIYSRTGGNETIASFFKLLSNEKCRLFTINIMTRSSVNRTITTVECKLTSATITVTDKLTKVSHFNITATWKLCMMCLKHSLHLCLSQSPQSGRPGSNLLVLLCSRLCSVQNDTSPMC